MEFELLHIVSEDLGERRLEFHGEGGKFVYGVEDDRRRDQEHSARGLPDFEVLAVGRSPRDQLHRLAHAEREFARRRDRLGVACLQGGSVEEGPGARAEVHDDEARGRFIRRT